MSAAEAMGALELACTMDPDKKQQEARVQHEVFAAQGMQPVAVVTSSS